jgi:hypothetical protein
VLGLLSTIADKLFGRWTHRRDKQADLRHQPYKRILEAARELVSVSTIFHLPNPDQTPEEAENWWSETLWKYDEAVDSAALETSDKVAALANEFREETRRFVDADELYRLQDPDDPEAVAALEQAGNAMVAAHQALLKQMKRETGL